MAGSRTPSAQEVTPDDLESASFLVDHEGAVELTCPAGAAWRTRASFQRILRRALADPPKAHTTLHLGEVSVRLTPMTGLMGRRFLLQLEPVAAPTGDPWGQLTGAQRLVAEYAAAGATTPEIARALGRSRETVKTHLKRIYRRLGVANRVELAEVLRRASGVSHS